VLATGGVLALSACLPGADPEPARPDPDLLLRRRVAAQVHELVAAYAAVIAAFPDAGRLLPALAAEHRAHVAALDGPRASTASSASPSPTSSASPRPTVGPVPSTPAAALGWLAGLERAAARRRTEQALRAGPDLARLLASVGACETTHALLLERA
jgi:hypothetical protein